MADAQAALRALERATIRLHRLIRDGMGDSGEADAVREEMLDSWTLLRPEQRALLDGLSGDLYMLQGEEGPEAGEELGGDVRMLLKLAWDRGSWVEILALLRREEARRVIPEDVRAYFRGRCWSSLGYIEAALCFYDYAVKLAPTNDNYAYLALDALVRCGRIDDALARANEILRDESSSSRRLFKAADVLFHAAHRFEEAQASIVYKRVLIVLERALESERRRSPEQRLPSLTVGAYVIKGFCHEHLGDEQEARRAYTDALGVDSKNDAALTARALLLYRSEPAAALRDFERAAATGTPLVWPYLYLAYDALRNDEYGRCIEMALQGTTRTHDPKLLANLFEWIAIASAQQGAAMKALQFLEEARTYNPFNERIAENLRDMSSGKLLGMSVANDTTPEEAKEQLSGSLRLAA